MPRKAKEDFNLALTKQHADALEELRKEKHMTMRDLMRQTLAIPFGKQDDLEFWALGRPGRPRSKRKRQSS